MHVDGLLDCRLLFFIVPLNLRSENEGKLSGKDKKTWTGTLQMKETGKQ